MNERMMEILTVLKNSYFASEVKAEFGMEASSADEILKLKELADLCGLQTVIKTGGVEAVKDMLDIKKAGVKQVVAPMTESPYAAKKFISIAKEIFDDDTKLYINAETKYIIGYLEEILSSDFSKPLAGVVFGRSDMASSLECADVNSDIILNLAAYCSNLCKKYGKEFIIGGKTAFNPVSFFRKIPFLTKFETRKIVFDKKALELENIEEGLFQAIEFEILWLENKIKKSNFDTKRIEFLKQCLKNMVK